ncbi:MAG: hypothetical protein HPY66_1555 [Firmicutes bacterium]|nr:hypothetical protein [Bacillota bacterium]
MIISAYSKEEALSKAQKIYSCDKSRIKIYIVRSPYCKFWGLIKREGKYRIELIEEEREEKPENQNNDGYIEIVCGKARVKDPQGEGRYASIIPGDPNINVYVNGEKIIRPTIVTEKDSIDFMPVKVEPVANIQVELSKDKMQATLIVEKLPGREYYIRDAEKSNSVKISSGYNEIPEPDVTADQCLAELEKANVKLKFINIQTVNDLLNLPGGGSAVVAQGIYPIDGQDSRVKLLFKKDCYRNPDFDTNKKVDLLSHTIIPTVRIGEVLAVKDVPQVPGRDGETVTGDIIKAYPGRDVPLKAGKGVILLENYTKAVSVSNGRPILDNGAIGVVPMLVVPHDVDSSTGNVYFDGDIQIKGNVLDNMKVAADGNIMILGSVLHAKISARGSVEIKGNIISSKVSAGLGVVSYLGMVPKLKQILDRLKAIYDAGNSEKMREQYENADGRLAKAIYESYDILEKSAGEIAGMFDLLTDDEISMAEEILKKLQAMLDSVKYQHRCTTEQIKTLCKQIEGYIETIDVSYENEANVILGYGQNSSVHANGSIAVTGRGCYQTDLIAKNEIIFKKPSSVVRGGLLIAGKRINMGIVGSPAGVSTYCRVFNENGKIDAVRFYSNTVLNVNGKIKIIGNA